MRSRFQFSLMTVFVVIFAAAVLASLLRLGHMWLAWILGGAMIGSVVSRRLRLSTLGGALGGAIGGWLGVPMSEFVSTHTRWWQHSGPRSPSDLLFGLLLGALIGEIVWFVKFRAHNPPPEARGWW
jgi:hypothetical protein